MKFMRHFLILFVVGLYFIPAVSHAESKTLIAENQTSENISITICYYDNDEEEWVTEGWWQAPPNRTTELTVPTTSNYIYIHAQSKSYIWPGEMDSDDIKRMIVTSKFKVVGANRPRGDNRQTVEFDFVEFDNEDSVTYEFVE